jgi:hypothetical protein
VSRWASTTFEGLLGPLGIKKPMEPSRCILTLTLGHMNPQAPSYDHKMHLEGSMGFFIPRGPRRPSKVVEAHLLTPFYSPGMAVWYLVKERERYACSKKGV